MFRSLILFSICSAFFLSCNVFEEKKMFSNTIDTLLDNRLDGYITESTHRKEMQELKTKFQYQLDSIVSTFDKQEGKFHVIAGSFKVDQNAAVYSNQLKASGYKTEIIKNVNGFDLVSVGNHACASNAISHLNKVKPDLTKEAWVYCCP
jgi:hypothetical protein